MRSSLGLGLLAGTTALAFGTLVVAAPVAAATIASGQKITIVEYIDSSDPGEGQFYGVNPADAASTPVGTATDQVIIGLEVGDDGLGAAIGQLDSESTIWTADANTGTVSNPQAITLGGDNVLDSCGGIDLVNGTFIISCVQPGDPGTSYVGQVNPATGDFIPFLTLTDEDYIEFDALANDVVTAQLWGFAEIGGATHSFTIDLENDVVEEVALMDEDVFAADFDRDGKLFVSTEELFGEIWLPALAVADPFTGTFASSDVYVSTTTEAALIFVAALTIWGAEPGPALAATGSEVAPVAIGSALLLLAGGAVVLLARRSRRTA
ncbi:hypothetical protein [Antiquaquibacter soli]|uniref:LPXTG cell wall anchor domain-containing protein n=1 Tax=Antiquaquibacter soli TaxID=3064523 RepID=A0ABT9BIE9_9MICO|nr:hypothetical protein [Protaetiibacter sp. WY-16]MDO7880801.1 hypothetical protein [Protaetiibacter sp. WY-16]